MYKIAVLGDRDSVLGFSALGFEIFAVQTTEQARESLDTLKNGDYAVIYMTEQVAEKLTSEIAELSDRLTPAIILIPGKEGSLGIGMRSVHSAVERAVGADILNN